MGLAAVELKLQVSMIRLEFPERCQVKPLNLALFTF